MGDCKYYEVDRKTIRSKEIRPDRQQDVRIVLLPWCSHRHSPVERDVATKTLGGANHLKCEGDRTKCPLSDEEFLDT